MAQSLKVASGLVLTLLLAGCGTLPVTKTSSQRLSNVLTTQDQAEAAYGSNDMQHAATLYLQLTKMVPQEADYWYMLGNAYVRTQEPDRAVQAYQQAIARNPDHTRAWHNLGIVRMRQAMAAFVSSAGTAKAGDPMRELSTQLADELARIGSGGENSSQTQAQLITASPRPVYVGRPAARSATGLVRRKPGGSASKDQP
jgi:cytochrome c-type biogenesis protein CcmH/NrfG